jgi:hypothetical protein
MTVKVANKRCRQYVQQRTPFQGSNLWGVWHNSTLVESNDRHFVVYSYGHHFPLFIYDEATQQWFVNRDKYSQSTTRHQSQARPVWEGSEMHWLSTSSMQLLATCGYTEVVRQRLAGREIT